MQVRERFQFFLFLSGYLWFCKALASTPSLPSLELAAVGIVRRLRPLFPLHVLTLVASLPFLLYGISPEEAVYSLCIAIENFFLLQSWIPMREVYFSCNAVSWYLSTYIFAAAVSPFLLRAARLLTSDGSYEGRAVAGIGLCAAIELLLALTVSADVAHWVVYVFPPVRLLDVFTGMLCGALYIGHAHRGGFKGATALSMGGGILMMALVWQGAYFEDSPTWMYSAVWVIPAVLIVTPSLTFRCVSPVLRPFTWVGNISLQLFLVHQLVFRYLSHVPLLAESPWPLFFFSLVLSLWLAFVISRFQIGRQKKEVTNE